MRRIAIVGAGQAGLHLGIGLAHRGYYVRLISNRTGEQIRAGRVLSSQAMLAPTLDLERDEKLELWEGRAPAINGIHLTWLDEAGSEITRFSARRARAALSIDQRVKMPAWMDIFEDAGGHLDISEADTQTLESLAEEFDLVVVAAGKGDISSLFPVDQRRIEYAKPQRHLALAYLTGVEPHDLFEGNDFSRRDAVGEMFMFPALTVTGACHIATIEAVPGGALDVFEPGLPATDLVDRLKQVAGDTFPWLARRIRSARPTDPQGTLVGRFAPMAREPVATLPSGASVLGAGDVVALNDPLTGQGANNAARCADVYLSSILERGDAPFTRDWIAQTGQRFVNAIDASTRWTNACLRPWPRHIRQALASAGSEPAIAQQFAEGFGEPDKAWAWWSEAQSHAPAAESRSLA